MQRLDTKIKTFYNEQLKRYEDVLSFLEKREEKMEASVLQKAEGFKCLYKEQFKEFGKLVEKRDKELEMDNIYKQKLWNDSLDQVNSNLVNIHCNTPIYTLVVFDTFRVFCKCKLNVS